MTIDDAINVDKIMLEEAKDRKLPGRVKALQMSVEALKRFKELREVIRVPYTALLPGETKD